MLNTQPKWDDLLVQNFPFDVLLFFLHISAPFQSFTVRFLFPQVCSCKKKKTKKKKSINHLHLLPCSSNQNIESVGWHVLHVALHSICQHFLPSWDTKFTPELNSQSIAVHPFVTISTWFWVLIPIKRGENLNYLSDRLHHFSAFLLQCQKSSHQHESHHPVRSCPCGKSLASFNFSLWFFLLPCFSRSFLLQRSFPLQRWITIFKRIFFPSMHVNMHWCSPSVSDNSVESAC